MASDRSGSAKRMARRCLISLPLGFVLTVGVPYLPFHSIMPSSWTQSPIQLQVVEGTGAWWSVQRFDTWCLASINASAFVSQDAAIEQQSMLVSMSQSRRDIRPLSVTGYLLITDMTPRLPGWSSFRALEMNVYRNSSDGHFSRSVVELAVGWPFRAFHMDMDIGVLANGTMVQKTRGALNIAGTQLAARPIWFGLIANTAIFSTMVFGMFSLTRIYQRRRRARKGLCVECRYSMAGLAANVPCPECGHVTSAE